MPFPRLFVLLFLIVSVHANAFTDQSEYLEIEGLPVFLVSNSPTRPMRTAVRVLTEEINKRTGFRLAARNGRPDVSPAIALEVDPQYPAESFRVVVDTDGVRIIGADGRGMLYGVGCLLRSLEYLPDSARCPFLDTGVETPAYPLRGHQLGYRYQANSYDAWDDAQYEQYIRELVLFGANSIENIPFQDDRESPHMPLDRRSMNKRLSEICHEYGLEYWVWTPAEFDLSDTELRKAHLRQHRELYRDCPELTGVFFPGGDPGKNPPELVLPFMEELARLLRARHPGAKVWLSLQWFNEQQCDDIYAWIACARPEWFGGLVAGPGSPAVPETRARLHPDYPLRHYPDITHTVRCQYPVYWWDPAFALTLGREPINPQPLFYRFIHNTFAPYTNGFISYSDGMNDDVNKAVWSMLGWNPEYEARGILTEYARFFFDADHAEAIADGILALEKNWEGPLAENGGVTATLSLWAELERTLSHLKDNWRWQSLLVRAYYDAYTRHRLLYETALEEEANAVLAGATEIGAHDAMERAMEILNRADTKKVKPELRERIVALFDDLFHSIGLQSSVKQYQACGYERGCSLDFLEYPLNNRWWLADQFEKVRAMPQEESRVEALLAFAAWAHPGEGSFYDDVGHVGNSLRVKRVEGLNTDPNMERNINPGAWWWEQGFSRERLSWQNTLIYPMTMVYRGLDPDANYLLRMTGYGEAKPRVNGHALTATVYGTGLGEFKEFPIPRPLTASGEVTIVWDPIEESHLNWREHARIAEVWLLRIPG